MSAASRTRFAEVVRAEPVDLGLACLLIAAEAAPGLDVDAVSAALDALAADARADVAPGASGAAAAEGLRRALGERAGFGGQSGDYATLAGSLLPEVLVRRRGLPILLSVVWLEVARRLGVPAYGVGLPGHFVVAVGRPDAGGAVGAQTQLVDPFAGGMLLSRTAAAQRVRDTAGVELAREHLAPCPPVDLLLRILTNVRVLAASHADSVAGARLRLWAVELSLLLPSHPLVLRREHGTLLARLGDFAGGAAELTSYADAIEPVDPDGAAQARRDARMASSRLN